MTVPSSNCLVWIDLEMTGLDISSDTILEIAALITTGNLEIIAEGPSLVIFQPDRILDTIGDWVKEHHTASGLIDAVKRSTVTTALAQEYVLDFVKQYCPNSGGPILCGNTIWQDRLFLRKEMPLLEKYFHHRMIDVSSIKELVKRWYCHNPKAFFKKSNTHRALEDIKESVAELKHYRTHFFIQ